MEPIFIYGSTILVLWAVAVIPSCMKNRSYLMLVLSGMVVLGGELYLSWDREPFPDNAITSIVVVAIAFAGGMVMHWFNQREALDR